jgi:hypothetical protein
MFLHFSLKVSQDAPYLTSMMPSERDSFLEVAMRCDRDVEHFCDDTPIFVTNPFLTMGMPMNPMQDFGLFMDSLMDTAIGMPMFVEYISIGAPQEEQPLPPAMEPEDEAATHVISQIAAYTDYDNDVEMTDRIVQHGNNLLQQEHVSEEKRRMARRLTEVSPEDMQQHRRAFLPFGCPRRNRCLQEAYDRRGVSPPCGSAMARLEHVRTVQYEQRVQQVQEEGNVLVQLTLLYIFAVGIMLVLYLRRRSDMQANRRMKLLVLKAIYSKPELKAAVEKELGESIGHVPPLGLKALMRFGLHGRQMRQWLEQGRTVRLAIVSGLGGLLLVAPQHFLHVCVFLTAWVFWLVIFSQKRVRMCACCCCGVTTEDVKNGTLTEEQACCGCCQGTGVCCVACADCCGGDVAAGTVDGCCCCGGDNGAVCAKDGCCCCCGDGKGMVCAKDGSGCCGCCSGDCCGMPDLENFSRCACCSGGSCCGKCSCCNLKSVDHVHFSEPCSGFLAKKTVVSAYEGVPMQIV